MWYQIDGDANPGAHGGTIAFEDEEGISLREIIPLREHLSLQESRKIGFPYWTQESFIYWDDWRLDLTSLDAQKALRERGYTGDFTVSQNKKSVKNLKKLLALILAHNGPDHNGPCGWAPDVIPGKVNWYYGVMGWEYLVDEDHDFRVEVLGPVITLMHGLFNEPEYGGFETRTDLVDAAWHLADTGPVTYPDVPIQPAKEMVEGVYNALKLRKSEWNPEEQELFFALKEHLPLDDLSTEVMFEIRNRTIELLNLED